MTMPGDATTPEGRCGRCGEPMATDQRYCIACGARRGPLPTRVAVMLSDRAAAAGNSDAEEADALGAEPSEQDDGTEAATPPNSDRLRDLIPAARAAAISLLLMIGFGCLIGAATAPGGIPSLAHTIVVSVSPPPSSPAATDEASSGGGGSGGGGGGHSGGGGGSGGASPPQQARTITITTPAPKTQTTRTVTVGPSQPPTGAGSGGGAVPPTTTPSSPTTLPPIGHVFEIVLSGQGYAQSFGTTKGHPFLAQTLKSQGELVTNYDAVAGSSLANEIALISGQGPTPQTVADCPSYSALTPGTTGKLGQARGDGCVYPSTVQTLGDELTIAGEKWRAYIQGIGERDQTHPPTTTTTTTTPTAPAPTTPTTPAPTTPTTPIATAPAPTTPTTPTTPAPTAPGTSTTGTSTTGTSTTPTLTDTSTAKSCPHPAAGATDAAHAPSATSNYVTWKNPFVYFQSVLDGTQCKSSDVGLDQLATDLKKESTTPAFSYIAPDPCDDGSDVACRPGAKAGLGQADTFLKQVVPEIERSAAYQDDGLILVTFDNAPQTGPNSSSASCCGQPKYPNLPSTSTGTMSTPTTTTGTTTGTGTTPTTTASCPSPGTTTSTTTTTPGTTSTSTTTDTTTTGATTTTPPADCTPVTIGNPPGGGQVGLLLISPYVKPGTVDSFDSLNHFSLLASIEKLLHLSPLGYASQPALPVFSPNLFTASKG